MSRRAAIVAFVLLVAACGSDAGVGEAGLVSTNTEFGPVLTDGDGHSLYLLITDRRGDPTCIEECTGLWAPAEFAEGLEVAAGIDAELVGSVTRPDGLVQLTFNDWPLYRYRGDAEPGDIEGHGQLNVWFAIGVDGEAVGVTE